MSRRICLLSVPIAVVLALVLVTPLTLAQDGGLTETFDGPDLPGWELSPQATVADGVLRLPAGESAAYHGAVADFALTVRARFASGQGELLVQYRAAESGAHQALIGPAYAMLIDATGTPLGGADFALLEGWFEIALTVQGDQHTLSINGQPVLSAVDARNVSGSGLGFNLLGGGVVVELDDLRLVMAGALMPAPDQGGATGAPAYEAPSWVKLGGPPGGLGYDIRMRPDNPDEMFVTDARAGIFKSVDSGLTWFDTNGNLVFGPDAVAPIFCATIDPHDYNVVWIGTQITGHLYRSPDSGQSWETRDDGIIHDGRSLRGITIDPNGPNTVFVGLEVEAGVWQREHPEASAEVAGGEVYKSTDGGLSFTRIWQGPNIARYVWIDPRNSNRVYVSTGIFDRIPANSNYAENIPGGVGILRSDDGGQTWTVLDERNGLGGRIVPSLFMHPTDPDTLIAAIFGAQDKSGIYVTRDGGDTWEQVLVYHAGMHNVEIATSDTDIWYGASENVAFRSDDGGQTWEEFRLVTVDREAGMPIDLQVDPRDPYRVFVNNYGGSNFLSTDGGETWLDASKGYTGASAWVSVMPDGTLLASANTAVFHSTDGGSTWVALTRSDETVQATDPAGEVLYGEGGSVLHSPDRGATWHSVDVVNLTAEQEAGRITIDVAASQVVVAPSDPQTAYLAFYDGLCYIGMDACVRPMPGLFRSHDGGYTWEEVPAGPFEDISTLRIVVHPQDSQRLYAATGSGLYTSQDGGDSWQLNTGLTQTASEIAIWDTDSEAARSDMMVITDVALDPFNPDVLYAATFQRGVFRSDDGGTSWQTASYGMDPNEPVSAFATDPNRPGVIYAGSRWSGVFVSTDGAQSWRQISEGLTNTSVVSLALSHDGSTLYAGTFSAGVWRLGGE